jgi:hypothetical protein
MLGIRSEVQNLGLRRISEPQALAAIRIPIENPKTRLEPAAKFTGLQPLTTAQRTHSLLGAFIQ